MRTPRPPRRSALRTLVLTALLVGGSVLIAGGLFLAVTGLIGRSGSDVGGVVAGGSILLGGIILMIGAVIVGCTLAYVVPRR